jgi:hypothetical protein
MPMHDHLSQSELIQFLDGELPEEAASRVQSHLNDCNRCRNALSRLKTLVEDLNEIQATHGSLAAAESSRDRARIDLRAKLSEASKRREEMPASRRLLAFWQGIPASFYFAGAAIAGLALVFTLVPNLYRSVAEISVSLPNRALTPGMTRPMRLDQMCSTDDGDFDPTVPEDRQQTVFGEYGISADRSRKDFQVDYLISPQLGGTDDIRNLWPQSYGATTWNAAAKDKLERHLYLLVCEKKIDLADAQHDIATNWIAAYQKYFRTQRPL